MMSPGRADQGSTFQGAPEVCLTDRAGKNTEGGLQCPEPPATGKQSQPRRSETRQQDPCTVVDGTPVFFNHDFERSKDESCTLCSAVQGS